MYERGTGSGKVWVESDCRGRRNVHGFDGGRRSGNRIAKRFVPDRGMRRWQVPYESVRCRIGNTSDVSYSVDVGFGGSRSTNINGRAAYPGLRRAAQKLIAQAAQMLDCAEDQVVYRAGKIFQPERKTANR